RNRAGRSGERPLSHAIAVASSDVTALVGTRPQHGPQLLVHGRLDRGANVLVDQCAQRDGLKRLRPRIFLDTFAHGVFLRWPPCKAARWSCTSPTARMRHFSFPPDPGHDPSVLAMTHACTTKAGIWFKILVTVAAPVCGYQPGKSCR